MWSALKGGFLDSYPQQVAKEQVDRVLRLPLEHDAQKNKNAKGISLAITYNNAFRNLSKILQKNFIILYLDAEAVTVFTLSPFFAYERARGFC